MFDANIVVSKFCGEKVGADFLEDFWDAGEEF